jgi:hypothetical protein
MSDGERDKEQGLGLSGEELVGRARAIEAAGVQRRHEELMSIAVEEDGIDAVLAEQVHALALEENLAPAYALALVATGIGVEELVAPESGDDDSIQQTAPDWVLEGDVSPASIARERRLRSSMRRLRHHLEEAGSAGDAVQRFLAEPDVGRVLY